MQPTGEALRGRFIQTLTEKSIAIQNMRGKGYASASEDYNGWKELVDLKNRKIHFVSILLLTCEICQSVIVLA